MTLLKFIVWFLGCSIALVVCIGLVLYWLSKIDFGK